MAGMTGWIDTGRFKPTPKKDTTMIISGQDSTRPEYKILEAGTHAAVLTQIIGIGYQPSDFEGVHTERNRLMMRFEVPAERVTWKDKDGAEHEGPMTIWQEYTVSLDKKANLRRDLESWRGASYTEQELQAVDLNKILGVGCMLSISHKTSASGKVRARIVGISRLMKGIPAPKAEGALVSFDAFNFTPGDLAALPEWLQTKVTAGVKLYAEMKERAASNFATDQAKLDAPPLEAGFDESDIPF